MQHPQYGAAVIILYRELTRNATKALAQCGFPYGLGKTTKTSPHPPVDLKSALRMAVTAMIGPARSMIDACVMLLDPMPRTGPRHQGTALQACLKLISAILGEDMQPDSAAKFLLRPSGAPIAVTSPAGVRRLQAKVEDVAAAVTGSPQRKRKRGRPKGSKNKKKRLGPTAPDVVAHAGTPSTDVVSSVEDMMELDVEEETEAMETEAMETEMETEVVEMEMETEVMGVETEVLEKEVPGPHSDLEATQTVISGQGPYRTKGKVPHSLDEALVMEMILITSMTKEGYDRLRSVFYERRWHLPSSCTMFNRLAKERKAQLECLGGEIGEDGALYDAQKLVDFLCTHRVRYCIPSLHGSRADQRSGKTASWKPCWDRARRCGRCSSRCLAMAFLVQT